MECLVKQLKILKESSKEAVESLEEFSEFKSYLHVKRKIEDHLFDIIKKASEEEEAKLILVCGSVGDGKSHIISYLKNKYPDIMSRFIFHNDATESNDPQKTAIETLNDVLDEFSDEKLNSNVKLIIAINLGTLNNFLDSKYGERFNKLREYIEENHILTNSIDICEKKYNNFDHVSFSEYHLYELTENGVRSPFLFELIGKIVDGNSKNIFHRVYQERCVDCYVKVCPIKRNFESLREINFRNKVVDLLIEVMIKYKVLMSIRNLLNFIFDIIVESSIDSITYKPIEKIFKIMSNENKKEILPFFIENLIFNNNKSNNILDALKKIDPLTDRDKQRDLDIISLGLNLKELNNEENSFLKWLFSDIPTNSSGKIEFIKYQLRYSYFENNYSESIYKEYLKDLFYLNSKTNVGPIYKKVLKAIYSWNGGNFEEKQFVVFPGKKQMKYKITKNLEILPSFGKTNTLVEALNRFNQDLILKFKIKEDEEIEFQIDYFLYEIFIKMERGYIPSTLDKNNYIKFGSTLALFSNYGKEKTELNIVDRINKFSFEIKNDIFENGWCIKWN